MRRHLRSVQHKTHHISALTHCISTRMRWHRHPIFHCARRRAHNEPAFTFHPTRPARPTRKNGTEPTGDAAWCGGAWGGRPADTARCRRVRQLAEQRSRAASRSVRSIAIRETYPAGAARPLCTRRRTHAPTPVTAHGHAAAMGDHRGGKRGTVWCGGGGRGRRKKACVRVCAGGMGGLLLTMSATRSLGWYPCTPWPPFGRLSASTNPSDAYESQSRSLRCDAVRCDAVRCDARFARRGHGCAQTARATGAVPYNASALAQLGQHVANGYNTWQHPTAQRCARRVVSCCSCLPHVMRACGLVVTVGEEFTRCLLSSRLAGRKTRKIPH